MRAEGLRGIRRENRRRTTIADGAETERPEDLVKRRFVAEAPNQLWVADLTYVRPMSARTAAGSTPRSSSTSSAAWWWGGRCPRRCVPTWRWTPSRWACGPGNAPVKTSPDSRATRTGACSIELFATPNGSPRPRPSHRSGRRATATTTRWPRRSTRCSRPSASATRPCAPNGGWTSVGDVEIAVAEYVDWFNHRRLHGEIGLVPPVEFEATHWASQPATDYRKTPVPTEVGTR
jgi:putative transposase